MKQTILIKRLSATTKFPTIIKKGEWIDLTADRTVRFRAPQSGTLKSRKINGEEEKYRNVSFDLQYIPLGVAMKLPEGYEAHVVPRSSTFKKWGVLQTNSIGVIDNSYSGTNDIWRFPALAMRDTVINKNDRICQFRIMKRQPTIEFEEVDTLDSVDRGGFGSTGAN